MPEGASPALMRGVWVRRSPSLGRPSFGQAVGARCMLAAGAGGKAWGPGTRPLACAVMRGVSD